MNTSLKSLICGCVLALASASLFAQTQPAFEFRKSAKELRVSTPSSAVTPPPTSAPLPAALTTAATVDLANANGAHVPGLYPPFTVAGWVNVTGGTGYLFSLGNYFNSQYSGLYHSGIVYNGTELAWAWRYNFNPFSWWAQTPISALPAGWSHVAAEVDPNYVLRVALNGQFVFSRQLELNVWIPWVNTYPAQAGGAVGVYNPNAVLFPLQGQMQDVSVWNSLVWQGQSFTPPAR